MILDLVLVLMGIGLLTAGGEALIRGALGAAKRLGISPLLSGLVIVGFGTSMPELVVSIDAAVHHLPDLAIGNVVGSNIANILLILGLCALLTPMAVKPLALSRDSVVMVTATVLFLWIARDALLGRTAGVLFLGGLLVYLVWAYRSEVIHGAPGGEVHAAEAGELAVLPRSTLLTVVAIVIGLAFLIAGSRLLVTGAVGIAEQWGVSQAVIGLTLVAVGTSLPELTVSVIAALRRHADVAIGNILGSNIFNLLGILGVASLTQPLVVNARILQFDQWVMLGAAVLLPWFLHTGRRLSRAEGAVLLGGYVVYIWYGLLLG
ncbi:MAG TPA: calcium/sodium antiporter [Thioalkalivibrio sp.]|nr:calcium/sodium antiporter [Thioalkalivibrio sp.]